MDETVESILATGFEAGCAAEASPPSCDGPERISNQSHTTATLEPIRPEDDVIGAEFDVVATHGADGCPGLRQNSKLRSALVVRFDTEKLQATLDAAVREARTVYTFEDFELCTGARSLTRTGRAVHLRPKVYHLLVHLLEHHYRAVSRDELCDTVWKGRCIGNATIDSTVKALRRALGDDGESQRVVRTHNGYGYRLVSTVEVSIV